MKKEKYFSDLINKELSSIGNTFIPPEGGIKPESIYLAAVALNSNAPITYAILSSGLLNGTDGKVFNDYASLSWLDSKLDSISGEDINEIYFIKVVSLIVSSPNRPNNLIGKSAEYYNRSILERKYLPWECECNQVNDASIHYCERCGEGRQDD